MPGMCVLKAVASDRGCSLHRPLSHLACRPTTQWQHLVQMVRESQLCIEVALATSHLTPLKWSEMTPHILPLQTAWLS